MTGESVLEATATCSPFPSLFLGTFDDRYSEVLAHEYEEQPAVLSAKIKLLAKMVRASRNGCVYSGAGISTASGVPDYATRAEASIAPLVATPTSPWHAQPTHAHRVLVRLFSAGHLKRWFQQNHDGLPQKAGLPQHILNEIHGSWWDPSNPVVKMSGQLRADLYQDLEEWVTKADLCLALGTSLAGMNADRLAIGTAESYARRGLGQGLVIIGVQQTQGDKHAALRIFSKLDHVFDLLAKELGLHGGGDLGVEAGAGVGGDAPSQEAAVAAAALLEVMAGSSPGGDSASPPLSAPTLSTATAATAAAAAAAAAGGEMPLAAASAPPLFTVTPNVAAEDYAQSRFRIPYGADGKKLPAASPTSSWTTLDLQEDADIMITTGPYAGSKGAVVGRHCEGHYDLRVRVDMSKHRPAQKLRPGGPRAAAPPRPFFAPVPLKLGNWWVEAAVHGTVPQLPVVNCGDD